LAVSTASARPRRWKRIEYDQLIDRGIFQPGERLELLGGQLIVREPQGGAHALGVELVAEALREAFGAAARIRVQLPVALDDESEPEPDVSVVGGPLADADPALPSGALLIVEVSDSSLALDRTEKASLYARAGIADYWILNLAERVLEVHREPTPGSTAPYGWRYSLVHRLAGGDVVSPLAAPQSRIPVARLTR
jgi:Uma2 family endonuclease